MHNTFTERVRKVVFLSREEAGRLRHDRIDTEHLLLGLIREGEGTAVRALTNLGLDLEAVRRNVENLVPAAESALAPGEIPFTPAAKRVLELSVDEARRFNHNYVGTEHLLLGLVREGQGVAARVIQGGGCDLKGIREELRRLQSVTATTPRTDTPLLDESGRDLTYQARIQALDPVFGRENEIDALLQVLNRRTQNSPLLVGSPGLGRKSIIRGAAQILAGATVPPALRGKRLLALDSDAMEGNAHVPKGAPTFQQLVAEAVAARDVVLVLYDIGQAFGGVETGGALQTLMKAIVKNGLQCIATATPSEVHRLQTLDSGFVHVFASLSVKPPAPEEAIYILRSLRESFEVHHQVRVDDGAIIAMVELSDRFMPHHPLPAKAIELMDQTASLVRMNGVRLPDDLQALGREIARYAGLKEASIQAQEFEKAAGMRDRERRLSLEYERRKRESESRQQAALVVTEEDVYRCLSERLGIPIETLRSRQVADPNPPTAEPDLGASTIHDGPSPATTRPAKCFLITPFDVSFEAIWQTAIRPTILELGHEAIRGQEVMTPGGIMGQIADLIRTADYVIADVSLVNANVYYEMGYADATGKPVILISRDLSSLPFDIRHQRVIVYEDSPAGSVILGRALREAIVSALKQESRDPGEPQPD